MRMITLPLAGMFACVMAVQVHAEDLQQLQTDDQQLVWFHPAEDYLAPHAARSFENSMVWQKRVFGWVPDGKSNILLKDFGDYGNAGARSTPNNALIVDIAPFSYSFETFVASDRIYSIMNHELVHVAMMDQWSSQDMRWRQAFGGKVQVNADRPESLLYHYLTVPRTVVPRWYLEGSAVFFETWMAGGRGRAQGAYDEMVFRAMVRDNAHFYDPAGLVSEGTKVDFQVGVNNYLYGTRFISWLALHYSPEKIVDWVARKNGSQRYYADQFEQVFGKPMESAWADWVDWEHEFEQTNLAAIAKYPVSAHKPLSSVGLGSISRAFYDADGNRMLAAFLYPGKTAYIGAMSLEDGQIKPLVDIKGPRFYRVTSLAYDAASKTAFYTTDNNAGFRDIMSLDTHSGEARMLFKDARIGDLVFNRADRSLWGIRHLNGIVTLVQMPYPYKEFHQVYSWPYGEVTYDLDISPDGKLLSASHSEFNGDQALQVMRIESLLAGDATPISSFTFGTAIPEGFVFTPEGDALVGSSYYTGVSNIFRYELATKSITALSNAQTGFFRPLPLPDGRMLAFDYTGQGLLPGFIDAKPRDDLNAITFLGAQVAEQHPIVTQWNAGSPSKIDLDGMTKSRGEFNSPKEIGLESIYPVVEGYKDSLALGMHAIFSDPIGLDRISLTASYSPDRDLPSTERVHFDADWHHRSYRVRFQHNDANFYDLFGPTKKSRRGNSWTFGYKKALIFDEPRTLNLDVALKLHSNLDELPGSQNVAIPSDKLQNLSASLNYGYILGSLGKVDDEKGIRWNLNLDVTHASGNIIPALYGGVDLGFSLFKHSSLWWRSGAGVADGEVNDPFANFYFGGFGNNWVDNDDIKRYRDHFSFPGLEISEVGSRRYARSMLEWNLPPLRFSNIGTPANYLSWARPALFAGLLVTNPGEGNLSRRISNLGIQVDLQFNVMHEQEMTLSFGYALCYEDGDSAGDEFMLSLKVLR